MPKELLFVYAAQTDPPHGPEVSSLQNEAETQEALLAQIREKFRQHKLPVHWLNEPEVAVAASTILRAVNTARIKQKPPLSPLPIVSGWSHMLKNIPPLGEYSIDVVYGGIVGHRILVPDIPKVTDLLFALPTEYRTSTDVEAYKSDIFYPALRKIIPLEEGEELTDERVRLYVREAVVNYFENQYPNDQADDLVQKVMKKLVPYVEGRVQIFESGAGFKGYVFITCRNAWFDFLKKSKRELTSEFDETLYDPDPQRRDEGDFQDTYDVDTSVLSGLLDTRQSKQERVLELRLQGHGPRATALILSREENAPVTEGAVKTRLRRLKYNILLQRSGKTRKEIIADADVSSSPLVTQKAVELYLHGFKLKKIQAQLHQKGVEKTIDALNNLITG
ncbi:MAG: hypothetical protein Q7R79_03530, partial [bacterium]|nr:hypothetical protein [bacterium]